MHKLITGHLYKGTRPELVRKGEEEEDAGPAMKLSWGHKGEGCTCPLLLGKQKNHNWYI